MPTRSKAQRIGGNGKLLVLSIIDQHDNWLARQQTKDFGIDLEAELAPLRTTGQKLNGKLIKLQVKTKQTVKPKAGHIHVQVERSLIEYADEFRLPVVLAVVCLDTHNVWWLWLQEWTLNNEARFARARSRKFVSMRIPVGQTLAQGLDNEMPAIAKGSTAAGMILALRGIVDAAYGWETREIIDGVVRILSRVHGKSRIWILQKVIDKLLAPDGAAFAFWEAQQNLPVLRALVKSSGNAFTAAQVLSLVVRGESYSRTGLSGLSMLYDHWRDNIIALDLVDKFEALGLKEVAWYAAMRERYQTPKHAPFYEYVARRPDTNLVHGKVRLTLDAEARSYIIRKGPNRGDSVLLDCLHIRPRAPRTSETAETGK